jgi:DNA end-binding protein Ku
MKTKSAPRSRNEHPKSKSGKAARSVWSGTLQFDLISIPVKAFTAKRKSEEISLEWLHEECNSPIHNKRVCPIHGEVPNDEIVSAYRYARGKYVVIEPDELQKLRKHSDKTIRIDAFVAPETIDRRYDTDKIYYLLPNGAAAERPFTVVRQAMSQLDRCGIAQTVLFRREHVVMLRVVDDVMLMTVLNYQHLFKEPSEMAEGAERFKGSSRELSMAVTLIEASTAEHFDFSTYADSYYQELTEYVEAKVKGREIETAPEQDEEPPTLDFAEALQKSLRIARKNLAERSAPKQQAPRPRKRKTS